MESIESSEKPVEGENSTSSLKSQANEEEIVAGSTDDEAVNESDEDSAKLHSPPLSPSQSLVAQIRMTTGSSSNLASSDSSKQVLKRTSASLASNNQLASEHSYFSPDKGIGTLVKGTEVKSNLDKLSTTVREVPLKFTDSADEEMGVKRRRFSSSKQIDTQAFFPFGRIKSASKKGNLLSAKLIKSSKLQALEASRRARSLEVNKKKRALEACFSPDKPTETISVTSKKVMPVTSPTQAQVSKDEPSKVCDTLLASNIPLRGRPSKKLKTLLNSNCVGETHSKIELSGEVKQKRHRQCSYPAMNDMCYDIFLNFLKKDSNKRKQVLEKMRNQGDLDWKLMLAQLRSAKFPFLKGTSALSQFRRYCDMLKVKPKIKGNKVELHLHLMNGKQVLPQSHFPKYIRDAHRSTGIFAVKQPSENSESSEKGKPTEKREHNGAPKTIEMVIITIFF